MPIAAVPDMLGALIAQLRTYTELTALTSTRISGEKDTEWPVASNGHLTHAIVMKKRGIVPSISRAAVGLEMTRVDFIIYGSTALEATRVWRQLHPILIPPANDRVNSFVKNGCRIYNFEHQFGPFDEIEDQTDHPIVLASYGVLWGEVAAA